MLKIAENVTLDDFAEGMILSVAGSTKVVCLEKLEADIVRDLINYGLDKTIEIFKSKYSGNTIEKDIKEFYLELVDKKVIIDIEGVK